MIPAAIERSARRPSPPVPFSTVIGVLLTFLALALALRWPRSGQATTSSAAGNGQQRRIAARVGRLPDCSYGARAALKSKYSDWQATLVDTEFELPSRYRPPDLASLSRAGFAAPFEVRAFVLPDLAALGRAAEAAGHPLGIVAAYRSYAQQADLFRRREGELGHAKALQVTARPGHSEHQLGTTVDFTKSGQFDVTTAWGASPDGRWLAANAYRFGFIQSYPKGRSSVTCYGYEPWHFRYFGRPLAARIHSSGLTVREFLWRESNNSKN